MCFINGERTSGFPCVMNIKNYYSFMASRLVKKSYDFVAHFGSLQTTTSMSCVIDGFLFCSLATHTQRENLGFVK
jgi:hypothetical protein